MWFKMNYGHHPHCSSEISIMARAKAFMDSPEYAPVKQMRMDNSTGTLVIVEGC